MKCSAQNCDSPRGFSLKCGSRDYQTDYLSQQITKHTYTPGGKKASITRAYKTPYAATTHYSYTPSGKLKSKTLPDGSTLYYNYHPLGYLLQVKNSEETLCHNFYYNLLGELTEAYDAHTGFGFQRKLDPFGNILEEKFSTGLVITKYYDALDRPLQLFLPKKGSLRYSYDPLHIKKIERLSNQEKVLYSHSFTNYDLAENLLEEEPIYALGKVHYTKDLAGRLTHVTSPLHTQEYTYDPTNNLLRYKSDTEEIHYCYDPHAQLTEERHQETTLYYLHDSLHNRLQEKDRSLSYNPLNQLEERNYDQNGQQSDLLHEGKTFQLHYDPLGRLIKAESTDTTIEFFYDPLNRCLRKNVIKHNRLTDSEDYLYDQEEEIAAYSASKLKNLRVLAHTEEQLPRAIALEIDNKTYAPLHDSQRTIRELIQLFPHKKIQIPTLSAFGVPLENPSLFIPWQYGSKRLHPELGCINTIREK